MRRKKLDPMTLDPGTRILWMSSGKRRSVRRGAVVCTIRKGESPVDAVTAAGQVADPTLLQRFRADARRDRLLIASKRSKDDEADDLVYFAPPVAEVAATGRLIR